MQCYHLEFVGDNSNEYNALTVKNVYVSFLLCGKHFTL